MRRFFAILYMVVATLGIVAQETTETIDPEEQRRMDSVQINELRQLVEELKVNELILRSELWDERNRQHVADSIKTAGRRHMIDSLRAVTPGVAVVVDGDTLMHLFAGRGGYSAADRAEMIAGMMERVARERSSDGDSVYVLPNEGYSDIMYGSKVIHCVTDLDALWQGVTREELVDEYVPLLRDKIEEMKEDYSFWGIALRALLFVAVLLAQWALFRLTNYMYRLVRRRIIRGRRKRLRPVIIRDYELLNTRQQVRIVIALCSLVRYALLLIQLMLTVPVMFAIFPQTENLAKRIFMYIIDPVKMVIHSVIDFIPNLFIILVIWYCIRYIIKGLRYIAGEIECEKLRITGFYPDWARPTFNIIRVLLYAFMIAMIYPYLPGANSGVFQGISVFVGLIISFGSSSLIGNVISGFVITYMRPFKVGDRIKLNDTMGNVIEKTPFVTRLRTPHNEVVTIPNSFVMSSHTVNYSASARKFGLIIHADVTICYDVPWRQVHQLLINAARMTEGVLEHPKPFVLESELQDYSPCYQINAYIRDADRLLEIYTELYQNIQDLCDEAGIQLMTIREFKIDT